MTVSKRTRKKATQASQKLLPETRVVWYAPGRSGPQPTFAGWSIVGGFVAFSALIAATTGLVVFPGWLLLIGIHHLVCPPRGLVICEHGIAVVSRSFVTGKPNRLVDRIGIAAVRPIATSGNQVHLAIGADQMWLTKHEEAAFRVAVSALSAPVERPQFAG
jgi:hypothetical protein